MDMKENFFPKRVSLWDKAPERWGISLLWGFKTCLNKSTAALVVPLQAGGWRRLAEVLSNQHEPRINTEVSAHHC